MSDRSATFLKSLRVSPDLDLVTEQQEAVHHLERALKIVAEGSWSKNALTVNNNAGKEQFVTPPLTAEETNAMRQVLAFFGNSNEADARIVPDLSNNGTRLFFTASNIEAVTEGLKNHQKSYDILSQKEGWQPLFYGSNEIQRSESGLSSATKEHLPRILKATESGNIFSDSGAAEASNNNTLIVMNRDSQRALQENHYSLPQIIQMDHARAKMMRIAAQETISKQEEISANLEKSFSGDLPGSPALTTGDLLEKLEKLDDEHLKKLSPEVRAGIREKLRMTSEDLYQNLPLSSTEIDDIVSDYNAQIQRLETIDAGSSRLSSPAPASMMAALEQYQQKSGDLPRLSVTDTSEPRIQAGLGGKSTGNYLS